MIIIIIYLVHSLIILKPRSLTSTWFLYKERNAGKKRKAEKERERETEGEREIIYQCVNVGERERQRERRREMQREMRRERQR